MNLWFLMQTVNKETQEVKSQLTTEQEKVVDLENKLKQLEVRWCTDSGPCPITKTVHGCFKSCQRTCQEIKLLFNISFACLGLINEITVVYIWNCSNHNIMVTSIIHKEAEIMLCFAALIAGWESEILPTDWGEKHPDGRFCKSHPAERRRDNPSEREFIKVRYCIHKHTVWIELKPCEKCFLSRVFKSECLFCI